MLDIKSENQSVSDFFDRTYLYKKIYELDFSMGLINFANRLFINF